MKREEQKAKGKTKLDESGQMLEEGIVLCLTPKQSLRLLSPGSKASF